MLWLVGFSFEVVADRQKSVFRNDESNTKAFITTGLWSYSRHPNYFGEMILWIGIAMIAAPVLVGWQWVALISPLFVIFLLTKVSGVQLLESQALRRWGDDPEYRRYLETTPSLIPRLPKIF
jgi:steroid 5-alpha reductase family enzyme